MSVEEEQFLILVQNKAEEIKSVIDFGDNKSALEIIKDLVKMDIAREIEDLSHGFDDPSLYVGQLREYSVERFNKSLEMLSDEEIDEIVDYACTTLWVPLSIQIDTMLSELRFLNKEISPIEKENEEEEE